MKKDYQKALKKLTLFFLWNPVPFNGWYYQKQKGSGTSDQSLFRLQNKFNQASAYEACDRTRTPLRTPERLKTCKKSTLVWLRKILDLRQIARLKQQRSLSSTFCKTQNLTRKSCVILLHWFSGEYCIIRSRDRRCSM